MLTPPVFWMWMKMNFGSSWEISIRCPYVSDVLPVYTSE
jgi:hypothetical protein